MMLDTDTMIQDNEIELRGRVRTWLETFSPHTPAIVVPVFNAYDDVLECIKSLEANTRIDSPILVLDDASTDDRIPQTLGTRPSDCRIFYARLPVNRGFVENVNRGFDWCAPRDVVILNSDVIVPPQWLERLEAAAYARSNIATATPFTNHGTILSVPYRNQPSDRLVGGRTAAEVDARIRAASLLLRPVIPTAIGHCTYIKRSALDSVGYLDLAFSPGYGEEVDFSQRAVMAGMVHVLADDLFLFHKGSRSFGTRGTEKSLMQEAHERIISRRYPWYSAWKDDAATDPGSSLARAVERARGALLGYRIAIDATRVDGTTTGTQVLTLELVRAIARHRSGLEQLALIINDTVPLNVLRGVDQLVDQVLRVSDIEKVNEPLFDLIHRPFQITSARDLSLLQRLGRRFIVSQLDCIAFANPQYAADATEWANYRLLTRRTFALADGVTFISNDVEHDAVHQGLDISAERKCVTYIGVDHQLDPVATCPPAAGDRLSRHPYILMLGTNFKHKNRAFALKSFAALIQKHQWRGLLVFAGPSVSWGGSESEESAELKSHPDLESRVCYLGAVSESEKRWLLEHAALVLYPSNYEGFGIVPFEAAAVGVPALTTSFTSLGEVLGDKVIFLETLNAEQGAESIWRLLSNAELAKRQVEAIQTRAGLFTWDQVATRLLKFYDQVLQLPPRSIDLTTDHRKDANAERIFHWRKMIIAGFRVLRSEGPGVLASKVWRRVSNHF